MSSVEEFNCILCKESFDNKDELQIHFRKHGDPKFNESIKCKSRIQNVAPVANEKSNDTTEMVNCDVCDELFPTISKAITHKHKLHPDHDAKYFCPWCGKLFTMKHLYNKHLQTNHEVVDGAVEKNESHFHCDSCDVFFFIPAAMIYHNKFFHRQDTELPIIGHSKKQKLFNQDLLPVYYCSFCGEEFINKVNLHKHICDDHNDENQRPTDVLRCPLCEAIFYHLDAYELHLTFHSSADLYSETNQMNETDMTEFSLETVPPDMERIEDLNNMPDDETNNSAVGIESFLQMAMDESHDGSPVVKKSKKHKKHKKSKKSAITLDEFLNMNQDVFGEDLDFQGVEEVPTKVIKRQLKPKKPQPQKAAVKFASSADLQKLQKQGIVVKMKPGKKPPPLQVKDVGQTVKISSHAKNVTNQISTKAISASNEVLSKLMNQSNNQLKIVKKPVPEKVNINEEVKCESISKEDKKSDDEDPKNVQNMVSNITITNNELNLKPTSVSTSIIMKHNVDSQHSNDSESNGVPNQCTIRKGSETDNDRNMNTDSKELNEDIIDSHKKETTNVNDFLMKDTLKNISCQITVKPINQSNKARIIDKPDESPSSRTPTIDNYEDVNSDTDTEQLNENTKSKTLDTLKNINSAITVKSLKNKGTINENVEQNPKEMLTNIPGNIPVQRKAQIEKEDDLNVNSRENTNEKQINTSSSHVLKNLSKNITIKSVSPAVKEIREDIKGNDQYHSEFEEDENDDNDEKNINRGANMTPVTHKNINTRLKVDTDTNRSTQTFADVQTETVAGCKELPLDENVKITNMPSSNNLLKHLKNITAKPVTNTKNTRQQITARSSNVSTSIIKSSNSFKKNEVSEEIEIFNIDDSDSDGAVTEPPKLKQIVSSTDRLEHTKPVIQSNATLNAIRNISKQVTVKSSGQAKQTNSIKKEKVDFDPFSDEDEICDSAANVSCDGSEDKPLAELKKVIPTQSTKKKVDAFQSVFKNLSKHITIKSRKSSPSPSIKSMDHVLQASNRNIASNDEESDTDESGNGKVKITEVTEDNVSDDDVDTSENKGVVIHSPENSDNENFSEEMEEFDDDDSKIPLKACKNSCPDLKSNNEFLKHISKNITIKSLNERTVEKQGTLNIPLPDKEIINNQNNISNNISIKSVKQKSDIQNESVKFRSPNSGYNKQNPDTASSCRPPMNSKLAQSPGVVNVNKEVKVKTYQSETVIEEITTTVTKTIRRVNQVNQQVYNASQTKMQAPRMIQQNNGPRMGNLNQPQKNIQSVSVRQSAPVLGPKIRQALPFRPQNSTSVRPSNQLVPIRSNTNQVRPINNPRMQVKNMPNQQRPIGKPLKISPHAMNQTVKRPATEETSGPFSCFKKHKESLIPDTALESVSDFHYASTSQINKFSSTTKTIRDNSVVTSKQMKSESTSKQLQMSRNSNVTGLKITKAKQVSEVEGTEISASKRTTLEAIEKLQKQGLLVKKPRVEEDFEPPDSGADDNNQFQDED